MQHASTGISLSHLVTRRFGCLVIPFRPKQDNRKHLHRCRQELSTRCKKLFQFLKRNACVSHYSVEWKKSQRVTTAAQSRSRLGRPWHRGESSGSSDRRNRTGKRLRRSSGFSINPNQILLCQFCRTCCYGKSTLRLTSQPIPSRESARLPMGPSSTK